MMLTHPTPPDRATAPVPAPRQPKVGIWAPVYGFEGVQHHPDDPLDASWARTRQLVVDAERWGYDSVLVAQHITNPAIRDGDILETWTASAALAEATERIEIIAAIKSFLFNPGVLAKMALGIDHISGGRFAINLISGWFLPEIESLGLPLRPHDIRYQVSDEWLDVVARLWAGERVTAPGGFFDVQDLYLRPGPVRPGGPRVYLGGLSEPALDLAARRADVYLFGGRPQEEAAALIAKVRAKAADVGRRPQFGMTPFIIARDTEREAQDYFEHLLDLRRQDDPSLIAQGVDRDTVLFDAKVHERRRIGSNGGTEAGLVGSYEQVAERMVQFVELGVDVFLIQGQPIESELERIADKVLPLVRERVAELTFDGAR